MKWITRQKVKVHREAFPWLIRKFIDSDAEFIFLPPETDWASLPDSILYDVPGRELGHHGKDVSFNPILKKYHLTDPALLLLGEIVERLARTRRIRTRPAKGCAGSQAASPRSG